MQVVIEDPVSIPSATKVEAGERLSFDDGLALYRTARHSGARLHGQPGARAAARQRHLLQREPPHQPHRRLRGQLPPVRIRQARARSQGLHHVARRGVAARRRGLERGGHRVPHRGRPASGADPRLVLRNAARPEAAFPAGPPEGAHHGGGRLPGAAPKIPVRETLERLRDAGMDSLPGGGAEIFNERVRRIICDHKIDGNEWLETARAAHQLGLRSNCTMLYGHIENEEDRVDHLVQPARAAGRNARLRDLHPAGLSSRQHGARSTSRRPPGSPISRTSPWRG